MHIALAEDDADQSALLAHWLAGGEHTVRTDDSCQAFIARLRRERFDVLLVDWMLPDGTGADILAWVRENLGWELPVIVITVRDDEDLVCAALQAGADDYVVKPPKQSELLARIAAVSRRSRSRGIPVLRSGAYEIDVEQQRVSLQGEPVTLTQKEFDLAVYLFQNPGKLLSRDHLLTRIWGLNTEVDTRTVDTHISRLRKKLRLDGALGWRLASIYGFGYRFERLDA